MREVIDNKGNIVIGDTKLPDDYPLKLQILHMDNAMPIPTDHLDSDPTPRPLKSTPPRETKIT